MLPSHLLISLSNVHFSRCSPSKILHALSLLSKTNLQPPITPFEIITLTTVDGLYKSEFLQHCVFNSQFTFLPQISDSISIEAFILLAQYFGPRNTVPCIHVLSLQTCGHSADRGTPPGAGQAELQDKGHCEYNTAQWYIKPGCIEKFPDWSIAKYMFTTTATRWEGTQSVMVAKLTRLTHKIAI